MGQANQIYARWKRILFSPDNPNEIYIVLEKDKPMTAETAKALDERYSEKDIIITITNLIRGKKHDKRK